MSEEDIHLVPYDPLWINKFEKEKKIIQEVLKDFITGGIHHVGSTSISNISAKPIIDIMVGVENLETAKPCISLLEKIDYHYYPYRPEIMHWFCKPSVAHREFHLYLMVPNSSEWNARLLFRDYLRTHEKAKKAYEELKIDLAQKFRFDREAYTQAKTDFVLQVVEKARQDLSKTDQA